ncbi:tyrosine-type recombinase/integrase [Spongiibacter sp. KMU-158]|uniref:Tyrosine-type recombinase/integrase n=1 Tax=Spongiibacter pelagi TaxID=2760804 RepID=A0A927C4F6_9GAMM|nr:integrase arm-type DNA-binding domain-containing protein [Spongiibacter pelagi]MBD2859692.1 tyrosine-type recombinase/integrase [Spongiibacter pelagi]
MPLTATAIKNAKPTDKDQKLYDQGGLYLMVRKSGTKTWKYGYWGANGKQGTYTIGDYPEISLQEAREAHLKARRLVGEGINPTEGKRQQAAKLAIQEKRFSDYCKEWIAKQNYARSTLGDLEQRLEKNIYSGLDKRPVDSYSTRDLLDILTPVAQRGAKETAKRMAGIMRQVFNDLLLLGLIDNNPAQGLAELLPKPDHRQKSNFGHITDKVDLKNLLTQIHNPSPRQSPITTAALKLMPLLFLRPYNIRHMKWDYIDFDTAMLTIPAEEMKSNRELKVPLAVQAIAILQEVREMNKPGPYVFITSHGHGKPMSENTTTAAIKRLINPNTNETYGTGFMTSHGFRHTASTFLNEMGYSPDAVELQLAHTNKDRVRATYNKAQLLDERIRMMQEWADYLENLRKT